MLLPTIYTRENLRPPAYQLRFSWTGWPSRSTFPSIPPSDIFSELENKWEEDGIRILETEWTPEQIQLTASVKPQVAPVFLAARLKGRLQHALRRAGTPVNFSRKLSVRSLGDTRSPEVEAYIRNQVGKEAFADSELASMMARFTVKDPRVNLAIPTASTSGRYWYNLHLVFLVAHRHRIFDASLLKTICDECYSIGRTQQYGLSIESLVPDHLHLALRGNIEQSAEEIALTFLNSLAQSIGRESLWEFGYYAGTFGEYDMGGVRS